MKFAVAGTDLQLQLAVVIPVTLETDATSDVERTKQTPVFIPLAADAVQPAMLVAQFLRELAVAMRGALSLVKLTVHRSRLRVNSATAIVKPFYF